MKSITNAVIKSFIKQKLKTDAVWAKRALIVVSDNQTADEFKTEQTNMSNGIGFTGADAHLLTSFAKQYQRTNYLSDKQMYWVHKKIQKYWGQVKNASDTEKLKSLISKSI